jgi:hypothetical protein
VDVLARVRGARIVRVIEAGADACGPFLVTEYAAGPSLAAHVDRHGQSVVIGCMVWRPGWPRRWR